jgi:long-chain acyl-CoA synthetase
MNLPWLEHYESLGINIPEFEDKPSGSFIEEHARIRPETIAIWYVTCGISYAEYNKQANRLANALIKLGVKKVMLLAYTCPTYRNTRLHLMQSVR